MLILCVRMIRLIDAQLLLHAVVMLAQIPAMDRTAMLHLFLRCGDLPLQFFPRHAFLPRKKPLQVSPAKASCVCFDIVSVSQLFRARK